MRMFGLLAQATLAYQGGNKALAKELGAKGRAANEAMKAAHAMASADIFSSRNTTHVQVPSQLMLLLLLLLPLDDEHACHPHDTAEPSPSCVLSCVGHMLRSH